MQKQRNPKFYSILAISLLALSFVPYGLMILLPYLSLSTAENAICVTTLIISGEIIQWIAVFIVGKQLITRYKKYLNPKKWFKGKRMITQFETGNVFVFKTSILTKTDISAVKPHLDGLLQESKWNFDLDDCDKILRVESQTDITESVTQILNSYGYTCNELLS